MNMKKIYFKTLVAAMAIAGVSCSRLEYDTVNQETDLPNAVYFEGVSESPMQKVAVDNTGGEAQITLRAANIVNNDVTLSLAVDTVALEKYNKENGTSYKLLPAKFYKLSANETAIKAGTISASAIKVNISPLDSTLNEAYKYAIPLRIVGDKVSGVNVLKSSNALIFGLDRMLETDVLRQSGFYMQVDFPTPLQMTEWTIQYGFQIDGQKGNQSILSGNFYSRVESNGSLQFKTGETDDPKAFAKQKIVAGKFYHLAFVYKNQHVKLYLNGVLDNEFDVAKCEEFPKFNMSWGIFSGYVRDIRVYNKALSAFQIKENLYVEDPTNPDLVFYAPLTKKTKLKDVTKNNNHFKTYKSGGTEITDESILTWKTWIFPEK